MLAGFILGFAVGIVIDQSYKLLGVADGTYVEELVGTLEQIPDTNATTLLVGVASLAILLIAAYLRPRWPRAHRGGAGHLGDRRPRPRPRGRGRHRGSAHRAVLRGTSESGWSETGTSTGALAVIFVGYSETLAAARNTASRHGYEIDPNQELVAQGAASAPSSSAASSTTAASRTSVADTAASGPRWPR